MKKFYYLLVSALISTAGFAQLRSVTFQVDMSGQTVSSNGVHIAGDFQDTAGYTGGNWQPNTTTLSQVSTSTVYDVTVSIPDGKYEFKFLNGDTWNDAENVPSESGIDPSNGNYNRWINIYKDTTLDAVAFGGNAPSGMELLRFQCDVANQTGVTSVTCAGNWQMAAGFPGDWSATSSELFQVNSNMTTVYERIFYVPIDTFEYKFVTNGSNWETVPSGCSNGGGNREAMMTGATVAGVDCYGACGPCGGPTPQYAMHFMVDMQNHLACNTMTYLDVAGSLNGWAGGDTLTDPDNDDIYEGTVMVDSGEVQFKFRAHTATSDGWEGVPNRMITLMGADTVKACFNVDGLGAYCTPIPAPSDITFRVDMAQWGGSIDTAGVFIIGDFTGWEDGTPIKMNSIGAGIYEYTYTGFCPGSMFYKFVNGTPSSSDNSNQENAGLDSTCAVPNGLGRLEQNLHSYINKSCFPSVGL